MRGKQRILSCLHGNIESLDHLPVLPITMMFAADIASVPYRSYAQDYHVLAAAQLKTARTFGLDHVSVISDPAREASDYGATVRWFDDQPPALEEEHSVMATNPKDVLRNLRLSPPDPTSPGSRMKDRIDGVALLREQAGDEFGVEGWVEGPCAEAADLRGINRLMLDLYDNPTFCSELFNFLVDQALRFAQAQISAGADWIGIGDAASSLIGPKLHSSLVLTAQQRLIQGIHNMGTPVRLHICGNISRILPALATLGCELVDLDSMVSIPLARKTLGPNVALCGNISPVDILRESKDVQRITDAIAACHKDAGSRFIVGAGCEVCRDTPKKNLETLCAYSREHAPSI